MGNQITRTFAAALLRAMVFVAPAQMPIRVGVLDKIADLNDPGK